MLDALVIGSGPNGLVAAATLARAGRKVLVCEAKGRIGGALGSLPLTEPGFVHDVGAAFFPFGPISPAFRALKLEELGLKWRHAPWESAHIAADGSCAVIGRDLERNVAAMGSDGEAWRDLISWHDGLGDRLIHALIAPLPAVGPFLGVGPRGLMRFAGIGLATPAEFSERHFRTEAARRIVPGLALHADAGPDDLAGAAVGGVLALLAARTGFGVPEGGAQTVTDLLVRRITEQGGALRANAEVVEVLAERGAVRGVRLANGEELEAKQVLADVGPHALAERLMAPGTLPFSFRSQARRFPYAWGTFKVDWALDALPPWSNALAQQSAVVHISGPGLSDMRVFTDEVRLGRLPEAPYLLVGQQTLMDPTRAPAGKHALYAYTHVPSALAGGWTAEAKARFADRVEGWIEACAPGFRKGIRQRCIHAPDDLEAMNANLVGGDLGGGTAHLEGQLFLRPAFPWFRHRMPVKGLYLCSASTHPGTGAHGACGFNAANQALADSN